MKTRLLPLALAAGCAAAAACGSARRTGPFGPPLQLDDQERSGEVLFMRNCNRCHPQGAGGIGPALNNKPLPDAVIRTQVRTGVGAMPAFSETMIPDAQLEAITAYLQALQESPGPL